MKYIFIVGAPGSKWSSVAKNIYTSPSIDQSDSSNDRIYNNDLHVNHCGAYWDPGMEFGNDFDRIDQFSRTHNELEFNKPFSGTGVRIVKSHCLSNHINYLKKTWPDCSIITVYRSNDACMSWWKQAGGWNISYPNYLPYYQDDLTMYKHIVTQNKNITIANNKYSHTIVNNNYQLAELINILPPLILQEYSTNDIVVTLL